MPPCGSVCVCRSYRTMRGVRPPVSVGDTAWACWSTGWGSAAPNSAAWHARVLVQAAVVYSLGPSASHARMPSRANCSGQHLALEASIARLPHACALRGAGAARVADGGSGRGAPFGRLDRHIVGAQPCDPAQPAREACRAHCPSPTTARSRPRCLRPARCSAPRLQAPTHANAAAATRGRWCPSGAARQRPQRPLCSSGSSSPSSRNYSSSSRRRRPV